ncbi:hypothetical protein B0H13DRAFT_2029521 [Mycena leptocephala]|nr:hypothetical protein B0H13DRAFT_2029521 [Mycena leptocephala]
MVVVERGSVAVSITGSILRLSLAVSLHRPSMPDPASSKTIPTRPPSNLYLITNILVPLPLPELGLSTRRGELPHILPVGCCGAFNVKTATGSRVFHSSAFFGRNYGTSFGLFIRYRSWMYIQRIFVFYVPNTPDPCPICLPRRVGFRCRLCV